MADLLARYDPVTGYAFLTSADEYPIPPEVWELLRAEPYRAEYSAAHRGELRLTRSAGEAAVPALREMGNAVHTLVGARPQARTGAGRGPMECAACGQPYVTGKVVAPAERCKICGDPLQLISPHVCGPDCRPEHQT